MSGRLDRVPGVVLVSIAAAMWGLDGLIRKPLAESTSAYTIVFGEHVVLVLVTLPLLVPAIGRALARRPPPTSRPGVAVGAGASAIATILFTKAIFHGDFITVVVLQKVQPLIVVVGAWLVLGEQPRPRLRLVPARRARRRLADRAAPPARAPRPRPDPDRRDARGRDALGAWAPSSGAS